MFITACPISSCTIPPNHRLSTIVHFSQDMPPPILSCTPSINKSTVILTPHFISDSLNLSIIVPTCTTMTFHKPPYTLCLHTPLIRHFLSLLPLI